MLTHLKEYTIEELLRAAEARDLFAFKEIERRLNKGRLAEKLLHDLTPGGSEFAGDPQYCYDYLYDRIHSIQDKLVSALKRCKELSTDL